MISESDTVKKNIVYEKRMIKNLLLLFLLCFPAFAETTIQRVAVIDFRGVGIETQILHKLSDQSRLAGLETLPAAHYSIITRENMIKILSDMGKDIADCTGTCEVDLARNMGADLVVSGDVMRVEGVYYLTLKLHETKEGTLKGGKDIEASGFGALKKETFEQSKGLFGEFLSKEVVKKSDENGENVPVIIAGEKPVLEGKDFHTVMIPAGEFWMGCSSSSYDCMAADQPQHKVKLTTSFYLMQSEVTQALYQQVMGENPSHFQGERLPVESVSWFDVTQFANRLSQINGLEQCYSIKGKDVTLKSKECLGWRLPTEAEWEYAARSDDRRRSDTRGSSYTMSYRVWYAVDKTNPVCLKQKNGYDLCDMSGNVDEWIWDRFGEYSSSLQSDPVGAPTGQLRVKRGGSWEDGSDAIRAERRSYADPELRSNTLGFRLARTL